MIPQSLSWFKHGLVNHSANEIYAGVSGRRDLHVMPLMLNLKALEAFMPITEDKLLGNEANIEQTKPRYQVQVTTGITLHGKLHTFSFWIS